LRRAAALTRADVDVCRSIPVVQTGGRLAGFLAVNTSTQSDAG
jgi:hypothetical protein